MARVEKIRRRAEVRGFALALVERARALAPTPRKLNRSTAQPMRRGLSRLIDGLGVHRAAVHRVRMAEHDRGARAVRAGRDAAARGSSSGASKRTGWSWDLEIHASQRRGIGR
jgi:hypothetical protein